MAGRSATLAARSTRSVRALRSRLGSGLIEGSDAPRAPDTPSTSNRDPQPSGTQLRAHAILRAAAPSAWAYDRAHGWTRRAHERALGHKAAASRPARARRATHPPIGVRPSHGRPSVGVTAHGTLIPAQRRQPSGVQTSCKRFGPSQQTFCKRPTVETPRNRAKRLTRSPVFSGFLAHVRCVSRNMNLSGRQDLNLRPPGPQTVTRHASIQTLEPR
jgi:hypothetical protein